ncbi:MAG TPA: TetR/AcrR family transcriptional regulator C-terminal domain-containing protein [Solirubrobacterales bacterium]|jgi:AcrR family transcriptional regulator
MSSQLQTPWNRSQEPRSSGLSRETIVAAAIEIADEDGIEAVSIRRIATRLEARPMSLYSHIEHKGELVDLMIDEVMGEAVLPGEVPEDWREALRQIAHRTRDAARAHPWMIATAFRRPLLGPKALRHVDQSLAAVAPLDLPFERKRAVLLSVDMYTLGYVRWEMLSPHGAGSPCAGRDEMPSHEQIDAYLREQVAGGEYPHLAAIAASDLTLGVKPESFAVGLEWLLAGIAAEVESNS